MLRAAAFSVFVVLAAVPARAEVSAEMQTLLDAMGMGDLIEIMREEGIGYGATLEDELFPGRGGAAWGAIVEQTYNAANMFDAFALRFAEELPAEAVPPITEFFASERGQRIVGFEISARRALLDEGIEEAAIEAYLQLEADGDPRLEAVGEFIDTNDLIESNVMGAMNSNYAFYVGLLDGNAFPNQLSEEQVLSDVWSQEEEIRDDTTEWVYSYLTMAYQPLSDEDLAVYTEMSRTDAGRALNRALFAAFDEIFVDISRDLGLAAARFIAGQDI